MTDLTRPRDCPQPGMALSPAQAQQQGLIPPMQAGTQGIPTAAGVASQPGAVQQCRAVQGCLEIDCTPLIAGRQQAPVFAAVQNAQHLRFAI